MYQRNQFQLTYDMFHSQLTSIYDFQKIEYIDWVGIDDDLKAAALYVVFFDQVQLAWYRLKTPCAVEEDCVSEVLLYLQKNVDKIKSDSRRYTPGYVYRVCYNCIYCKSVDIAKAKTGVNAYYNNTVPNIVKVDSDELDLFDTIVSTDNGISDPEQAFMDNEFWEAIEGLDDDVKSIVYSVLEGKKLPKSLSKKKMKLLVDTFSVFLDDLD